MESDELFLLYLLRNSCDQDLFLKENIFKSSLLDNIIFTLLYYQFHLGKD